MKTSQLTCEEEVVSVSISQMRKLWLRQVKESEPLGALVLLGFEVTEQSVAKAGFREHGPTKGGRCSKPPGGLKKQTGQLRQGAIPKGRQSTMIGERYIVLAGRRV